MAGLFAFADVAVNRKPTTQVPSQSATACLHGIAHTLCIYMEANDVI